MQVQPLGVGGQLYGRLYGKRSVPADEALGTVTAAGESENLVRATTGLASETAAQLASK